MLAVLTVVLVLVGAAARVRVATPNMARLTVATKALKCMFIKGCSVVDRADLS